jgi:hypothetical protein
MEVTKWLNEINRRPKFEVRIQNVSDQQVEDVTSTFRLTARLM